MSSRSLPSLHPQMPWLFAFGAVALGLAVGFLTKDLNPKISAAIYAGIVGLAGFLSMYLTRAKLGTAVLAFFVAAAACAGLYYVLVSSIMSTATSVMTDAVSGGQAHEQGKEIGTTFGRFFGVFAAAIAFLETFIGGVIGAVAGRKLRAQSEAGQPSGLAARAAR
jgi:hypothetical protein